MSDNDQIQNSPAEGLLLSWWQMAIIKIAGMVCLPVLIVGAEIGKKYGLMQAALAIFLGNLALFLLGLGKCSMAVKNKCNTMENATSYFGSNGTKLFSLNIIISLIGWFAIQLNIIALSMEKAVGIITQHTFTLSPLYYNIILGTCITVVALSGIKGLNRLATFCAPLLFSTIAYSLYAVYHQAPATAAATDPSTVGSLLALSPFSFTFAGVSLVIATAITAIIDLPTYYRYSRSLRDGQVSLMITFLCALPILELVGAYIATKIPGDNFVDVLSGVGGTFWQLWIALFLIFAGWTTNNTNVYSAAVALEQLFWKNKESGRIFLIGLLGTFVSCFNLINAFTPVLNGMGILVSSMGAVIICNYFYNHLTQKSVDHYGFSHYFINILSWAIGAFMGFANMFKLFSLTGIELIDAFLAGGISTFILLSQQAKVEKLLENVQLLIMKRKKNP